MLDGYSDYYQIPNNSDERNNSDGWKDAWILIIAMTGIIALGVKSFNFNNSDGLNNSNHIISLRPKNNLKKKCKKYFCCYNGMSKKSIEF